MSLKAGWYPQDDGGERFWDGTEWTDAVRSAGTEERTPFAAPVDASTLAPDKTSSTDSKGCLYIVGVIVMISIAVGFNSCGGDDDGDNETNPYAVQGTCQDIVKARLKNPSTADFNDGAQGSSFAAGSVTAQNALGGVVTYAYRCTLDTDGSTVRLQSFTER